MIASLLRLSVNDMARLKLKDAYSLHRIVYDLFERTRDENDQNTGSGILYADKGSVRGIRKIIIMSDRQPCNPTHGSIETKPIPENFLTAPIYKFEIVINPVKRISSSQKIIPICGEQEILEWFTKKSPTWGFQVNTQNLDIRDINVDQFFKKGNLTTITRATITGLLVVTNQQLFTQKFAKGIGRAKTFGCGLLQITPVEY